MRGHMTMSFSKNHRKPDPKVCGKKQRWMLHRKPGTKVFLKNYRRMLAHMTHVAATELSQAESDQDEAGRAHRAETTNETLKAPQEANEWVKNRELNVDWIAFKIQSLNEKGVYILTEKWDIIPLTDREKQWNSEMNSHSPLTSVASAGAATPAASSRHNKIPYNTQKTSNTDLPTISTVARPSMSSTSKRPPTTEPQDRAASIGLAASSSSS